MLAFEGEVLININYRMMFLWGCKMECWFPDKDGFSVFFLFGV